MIAYKLKENIWGRKEKKKEKKVILTLEELTSFVEEFTIWIINWLSNNVILFLEDLRIFLLSELG